MPDEIINDTEKGLALFENHMVSAVGQINRGYSMKDKRIEIRLSEDDYDVIENNAKACGMTTSAYLRYVGCNMMVLQFNLAWVQEYIENLDFFQKSIEQTVFTIYKRDHYLPPDVDYILEKTRSLLKYEEEFAKQYGASFRRSEELLRAEVRNVVNEGIKGKE